MRRVNSEIDAWKEEHPLAETRFQFLSELESDKRLDIMEQACLAMIAEFLGKVMVSGMLGLAVGVVLPEVVVALAGGATIWSLAAVVTMVKVYVVVSVMPLSCFAFAEYHGEAVREFDVMDAKHSQFKTFAERYFHGRGEKNEEVFLTREQARDKALHRLFHKWKDAKRAEQATEAAKREPNKWPEWSFLTGAA